MNGTRPKRTRRRQKPPINPSSDSSSMKIKVVSSNGSAKAFEVGAENQPQPAKIPKVNDSKIDPNEPPPAREEPGITGSDLAGGRDSQSSNSPAAIENSANGQNSSTTEKENFENGHVSDVHGSESTDKRNSDDENEGTEKKLLKQYPVEYKLKAVAQAKKTSNRDVARYFFRLL